MKHVRFDNYLIFIILPLSFCCSQTSQSPIPQNSQQLILVLTDSSTATNGFLYRFEREQAEMNWKQLNKKIPILLGRNGMAWGNGLQEIDTLKLPMKTEGDGKSPAGVFPLSTAFGYARRENMHEIKINYIQIEEPLECVDDPNSKYYNQIVNKNDVDKIDWQSSEKMYFADVWYEQGVIIDQNINPTIKGGGSCIFLHNWSVPNETTAGCTEMNPKNLKEIIFWLDSSANPVFVQLTRQLYDEYEKSWNLPVVP